MPYTIWKFMNRKKSSIDGFIPRRPGSQLDAYHEKGGMRAPNGAYGKTPSSTISSNPDDLNSRREIKTEDDLVRADGLLGQADPQRSAGRSDIDDSLREIDQTGEQTPKKLSRRERRRLKRESRTKAQKIRRRIIKIVVLLLVLGVLGIGGFLAYKTFHAAGTVLKGNVIDLIQNEPLKEDANGRSNFLIVGTSEDDPGHEAGYLTDSIMVLSVDQDAKNAYMFSIPRDLYVEYGMACTSGYRGKINVYFSCANEGTDAAAEQDRLTKTQAFIGSIVGLDIQYGVHVNYTVMRDVINAIGGSVTVTIESRDSRGVMDSNFDWKCGATYATRLANCPPDGHYIQYANGEVTLDAEHALYLAQARGDTAPTYGFEQSNFDRERNQQKILVAIREKAMSAGTLTNLSSITGLIDALGNNLRTNIETKEVRTIADLAQNIPTASIQSIDLYSEDNPLFTTGPIDGASSVYPKAGVYNYTDLQAYLAKQLSSDPFVKEEPHVIVLNGTETAGVAQTLANTLEAKGFTVDSVDNAPEGTYDSIEIYQVNSQKTATAAKLKQLYNVTIKTTTPPVSVTGETDFVIIIGNTSAAGQ